MVKLKARYSTGSCSFISLDGRLRIAMEVNLLVDGYLFEITVNKKHSVKRDRIRLSLRFCT